MSLIITLGEKRGEIYRNGKLDVDEELWDKLKVAFDKAFGNARRKDRLSKIKARCDTATPGPWEFSAVAAEIWTSTGQGVVESTEGCGLAIKRADSDFIAHAREDIPYLLAEIERLESALMEHTP